LGDQCRKSGLFRLTPRHTCRRLENRRAFGLQSAEVLRPSDVTPLFRLLAQPFADPGARVHPRLQHRIGMMPAGRPVFRLRAERLPPLNRGSL
jgi:hypothetical protein